MPTKERPILFSGPMVRAILDGRKTQTRRIIKLKCHDGFEVGPNYEGEHWPVRGGDRMPCPYGKPVDRLWVRETWGCSCDADANGLVVYRADRVAYHMLCENDGEGDPVSHGWKHYEPIVVPKWKPSIHMPRWASRITLEITGVRVERLQDISEADAMAEGVERIDLSPRKINGMQVHPLTSSYFAAFMELWRSINGPESWAANPWVWVVEFRRCEQ